MKKVAARRWALDENDSAIVVHLAKAETVLLRKEQRRKSS